MFQEAVKEHPAFIMTSTMAFVQRDKELRRMQAGCIKRLLNEDLIGSKNSRCDKRVNVAWFHLNSET